MDLTRIESVQTGTLFAGIHYDTELAGPGGCHVTLFPTEHDTAEGIAQAKRVARGARDVVGISVCRVKAADLPAQYRTRAHHSGWIMAARWIAEHKECRRVIPETGALVPKDKQGGILLDLFSATTMVRVYDALSEKNREKFGRMDLRVAHHVAFGVLEKCGT